MQQLLSPPREALTTTNIYFLIQNSSSVKWSAGAELLDINLNVVEDISSDFSGGTIQRANYADLHSSATFGIARELNWANAIVRPYVVLTSGVVSARFNLGAYFTNAPDRIIGSSPVTHEVQGVDLLHALKSPVGDAYSVPVGTSYLTRINEILVAQGFTQILTDQSAATKTVPSAKTYAMAEDITWLKVVNDLLAAIGYQGIWSDWNGYLRCVPYIAPVTRTSEWTYTNNITTSMLAPERKLTRDYFDAPNKWIAVKTNGIDSTVPPTEGAGIYTVINQSDGETSIDSRGRTLTRYLGIDAADQASLVATATRSIEADKRIKTLYAADTAPNPLHWHFDRIRVEDSDAGAPFEFIEQSWSLPLNGGNQSHVWAQV